MSNVKAYLEDIVRDGLHDIAEALKGSGPSGDVQASHVIYDNTESGLTSTRVQGAIDELSTKVDTNTSGISDLTTRMGTAEGDITSLDGRLDTAEEDITALETWKDNLDASDIPYDSETVKDALDSSANKVDIATVETGSTASRAYSVGELVYVNGNLYKVITAIASGATFTVGTNIQSTNVSDAFTNILDTYTLTSANNGSIKFFKKNGVVTAIISVLKTATNGEVVTFGTLPSSYRPTEQINVNPRDMNEPNGSVFLVIKSTGEVTMENYGFSTAGATMNNARGYLCTYLV